MASTTYHTIAIRGGEVRDEGVAKTSSAITPGMLLEFDTGELDKHGVDAGVASPVLVALESPTAAAGTTAAIDTAYANGETVYYAVGQPGDVFYMYLAHSTGNNAVKGVSKLVSKGNGYLKVNTVGTAVTDGVLVGVPEENLDNSATGGSAARIRVRIA